MGVPPQEGEQRGCREVGHPANNSTFLLQKHNNNTIDPPCLLQATLTMVGAPRRKLLEGVTVEWEFLHKKESNTEAVDPCLLSCSGQPVGSHSRTGYELMIPPLCASRKLLEGVTVEWEFLHKKESNAEVAKLTGDAFHQQADVAY